jgi:hypothetical protein
MILAPLRTIRVSLSKRVELLLAVSGDLLRLETDRTPPRSPATSSRSRSQEKPDENTALAMALRASWASFLRADVGVDLPLAAALRQKSPLGPP